MNKIDKLDISVLYKMLFIYNALSDGWSVRKLEDKKYEFTKNTTQKKELDLENIESFIKDNLDIQKILE
tara:strand:- start:65 stop:271 length:207 start_codon:yes stop_codon:yes gene_type:complete